MWSNGWCRTSARSTESASCRSTAPEDSEPRSTAVSRFTGLGRLPELQPLPDLDQRLGQLVHHLGRVLRSGREAQPLGAARNGREVDRLDVESVLGEQDVADLLRLDGGADQKRDDVGLARHL